jgi:hypothetical protein
MEMKEYFTGALPYVGTMELQRGRLVGTPRCGVHPAEDATPKAFFGSGNENWRNKERRSPDRRPGWVGGLEAAAP